MKRKLILLSLFHFILSSLIAQRQLHLTPIINGPEVVTTFNLVLHATDEHTYDSSKGHYYRLFPEDLLALPYEVVSKDYTIDTAYFRLLLTGNEKAILIFDSNQDDNFRDDIHRHVRIDEENDIPVRFKATHKTTGKIFWLENTMKLSVEREKPSLVSKYGPYRLNSRIFTKYYKVIDTLPEQITLLTTPTLKYMAPMAITTLNGQRVGKYRDFYTNEPIYLDSNWYVFENLDQIQQTIDLRQMEENEKRFGYREGHIVDMNVLNENTSSAIDLQKKPFLLLHFWGPWCYYCKQEYEANSQWRSRISNSDIQWVDYAYLMSNEKLTYNDQEQQIDSLITAQRVSANQTIIKADEAQHPDCSLIHRLNFQSACNAVEQFLIGTYPSYILLSREGEIIYRHRGAMDEELEATLEKYLKK